MAIPGSGAISMSMFNTELGRASNRADSSLAGGTTPAVGSLFWLGGQSGSLNQTAPHAMSEWYGYTATPSYTVTFYAKLDTGNPPPIDPQFYLSINGGDPELFGSLIDSTTCTLRYSNVYTSGTNIALQIVNPSNTSIVYRFGGTTTSTTCPAVGTLTARNFNITGNTNTAFTVQDV